MNRDLATAAGRWRGLYALFACALAPFMLLATANSAGYRYGASDLAFYGPAVIRHLDPRAFPRDRALIDAQARLTLMDETIGSIARVTTTNLPVLFVTLYLASLGLLAAGAAIIGSTLYTHRWSVAALLMALTLRHAIAKSGANTLEAYFHPRQLAFACGVLSIAAFLRARPALAGLALLAAALLHPTTTLWFGVWLAAATVVATPPRRRTVVVGLALLAAVGVWMVLSGPLAGRLSAMDGEWLNALGEKEYLFPMRWPISAWLLNLGYLPLIWWLYRRRARAGLLHERETALVYGVLSLVVVFMIAVVLQTTRLALAIQLQPARVFWLLDLIAIIYLVWRVADAGAARGRPVIAAAIVLSISAIRGLYVLGVEFPNRPLFEIGVPGDWGRVMAWARQAPLETGWLAHPNHAAIYGTSVRMAAGRDVFVEAAKDGAIGIYDRSVALRTRDRLAELEDFTILSAERARDIAARHGLDYMITEQELRLPLAFTAGAIRVYRLR